MAGNSDDEASGAAKNRLIGSKVTGDSISP